MKTISLRRNRSLQIESLENREMLSAAPLVLGLNADDAPAVYAAASPAAPLVNADRISAPVALAAAPADANAADLAVYDDLIARGLTDDNFGWDGGAIVSLNAAGKGLTGSLDVSGLTALTKLDCSGNALTYLDVSKNTALTTLDCSYNDLSALDVSKNTALTTLDCSYNNLSALDVSKNTALTTLDCRYTYSYNPIVELALYVPLGYTTSISYSSNTKLVPISVPTDTTYHFLTEGKETKSVTIKWTAPQEAVSETVSYVIQYREVRNSGKWKSVTVKVTRKSDLTKDLALKANTQYEFRVFIKGEESKLLYANVVRTWSVLDSSIKLTTLKAKATDLPAGFLSQEQLALRVSGYYSGADTLTVTYTYGKAKAGNLKTVTLTRTDGKWVADSDAVTFEDGLLIISNLEKAAKYTVTARFSYRQTEGSEATAVKATSKVVSTTKRNWQPVTGISAVVSASSGTVTWEAAKGYGDAPPASPATYTVKFWYNGKVVKKIKATSTSLNLTAALVKSLAKYQDLTVTVVANADKTHVAGNEADAIAAAVNWRLI